MSKSFEFFKYIKTPLSEGSIMMLYQNNGVLYEKTRLFGDVVLSFFAHAFDTYMGDDIKSEKFTLAEQRFNHFNWCWNKTMEDFSKEGIHFHNDTELREYFSSFMFEVYYTAPDKSLNSPIVLRINDLWGKLFDYKGVKTHSDVDSFLEIYGLFNGALKSHKKG